MASANRPARLNRVLLLVVAVVLVAAAAFALLTAFGVLGVLRRDQGVTPRVLVLPGWAAYVAVVVAVILGLLCVRWLVAQTLRRPKTGTWHLEADRAGGVTRLDAQTAVEPFVAEVESCPGVARAAAWLAGSVSRPVLHVVVGTDDDADINEVRRRIDTEAVRRLQQALDLDRLPTDVLIRLDDARSARLT